MISLFEDELEAEDGSTRSAVVLESSDWLNVVAKTASDEILFVRQWRFGSSSFTLEIPGGMIEPGEDKAAAAKRELFEETGYRAGSLRQIGKVMPNPAIQTNRCFLYLAEDLKHEHSPVGDGEEEIEVVKVPLREIREHIRSGKIEHALVIAAFYFFFESMKTAHPG